MQSVKVATTDILEVIFHLGRISAYYTSMSVSRHHKIPRLGVTYQFSERSALQASNIILATVLQEQGVRLHLVGAAAGGAGVVLGTLAGSEAVAAAGEAAGVEADEVGIAGGLDLSQVVAVAAGVAPALEVPVGRDAAEADGGEDVDAGAAAAGVGVDVGAQDGVAAAAAADVEIDVNRGNADDEAEEDLREVHFEEG